MDYYFTDRQFNVLQIASTSRNSEYRIPDDLEKSSIEADTKALTGTVYFDHENLLSALTMCQVGNYILYRDELDNDIFMTIMESHSNSTTNTIQFTAEDAGVDLLNEIVGAYKATKALKFADYFNKFTWDSGWTIGVNEIPSATRTLEFEGETTSYDRMQSVATEFGVELYFSFEIVGTTVTKRQMNVVKKRGKSDNVTLRVGKELNSITVDSDIYSLATSIKATGGTPEGKDTPITLKGYKYVDPDGRFVLGADGIMRDMVAVQEWSRLKSNDNPTPDRSHLQQVKTYDAVTQETLCQSVLADLKQNNHPAVNYVLDIAYLPETIEIGDIIHAVDDDAELYISARLLELNKSRATDTHTATLGDFLIEYDQVNSNLRDLADKLKDQSQLVNDVKNGNKSCTVYLITPNGTNWSQGDESKRIIARVFVGQENITSYFSASAFTWSKTDSATGVHDADWESKHENDGYQIELDEDDVGTITCTVDGDYLKVNAEMILGSGNELVLDQPVSKFPKDFWGSKISGAFQYQWLDKVNNQIIVSMEYTTGQGGTAPHSANADTKYYRFKTDGTLIDAMLFLGGGHGASFGARLVDGVPEIWSSTKDESGKNEKLSAFKWQPNTVVSQTSGSTTICDLPAIGAWKYRRISVDFDQGWVLGITGNGWVEVVKMEDVLAGNWIASYKFKLQSVGFNIVNNTTNDGTHATMQSNDIHFPYIFANSGDVNGLDPRVVACINLVTESVVFWQVNTADQFGYQWLDQTHVFEPEAVGYYEDDAGPYLLQGFSAQTQTGNNVHDYRALFKTRLDLRDDSSDIVDYPPDE